MYQIYKKLRDDHGFKDSDVAKKANISKSTFSDWKSGRSKPGLKTLQRIANVFNVSVDYIANGINSTEEKCIPAQNIKKEIEKIRDLLSNKDSYPLYYDNKLADEESLNLILKHINLLLAFIEKESKNN